MDIEFNFDDNINNKEEIEYHISKNCLEDYIKIIDNNKQISFLSYTFLPISSQINLNNEFLKHNYNTDIITFNVGSENNIIGDIYISFDQIKENSKLYKEKLGEEFQRVLIHGVLHLLNYNDISKEEKEIMRKEEDKYIKFL